MLSKKLMTTVGFNASKSCYSTKGQNWKAKNGGNLELNKKPVLPLKVFSQDGKLGICSGGKFE